MTAARPELVFLSGPQEGERAVLMNARVVAGRATTADIVLREEFASRLQMEFTLTEDGWVVENLSDRGTRISGKKYKAGKKILLATGDIIGIGAATEILYVEAGDDPTQAVTEYRKAHPLAPPVVATPAPPPGEIPIAPVPQAGALPAVPLPPALPPAGVRPPPLPQLLGAEASLAPPPARPPEELRKAKLIKYAVGYGVFLAALIGGVAVFMSFKADRSMHGPDRPPELSKLQLEDLLAFRPEKVQNTSMAGDALKEARAKFQSRLYQPGDLYKCLQQYNLNLAFRGSEDFADSEDSRKFQIVKSELAQLVSQKYDDAWRLEQSRTWHDARVKFDEMLRVIPDPEHPIYKNVVQHIEYVNRHTPKRQ